VLGGAGGAIKGSRDKARWKAAGRSPASRALLAEFTLCLVVVALSPAVKPAGEVKPADWMKRGSAVCGFFILLGLLSSIGPRSGRVAVAVGGLVTLGLLVDGREVFGQLAAKLAPLAGGTVGSVAGLGAEGGPESDNNPSVIGGSGGNSGGSGGNSGGGGRTGTPTSPERRVPSGS
jgi:hypothetical protein